MCGLKDDKVEATQNDVAPAPSATKQSPPVNPDPHNVRPRFLEDHAEYFDRAMREIRNGQKESCWSWFLLPTPPYIVDGVERGSPINRMYALRGEDAVQAYLTFPPTRVHCPRRRRCNRSHSSDKQPIGRAGRDKYDEDENDDDDMVVVHLRQNYVDLVGAIRSMLLQHGEFLTLNDLLGSVDGVKAISSFQLFERVGRQMGDVELMQLCREVLTLCGVPPPPLQQDQQDDQQEPQQQRLKKRQFKSHLRHFLVPKKKE